MDPGSETAGPESSPETAGPKGTSDSDLVASVLSGNPERFEELVLRYQPRLFATARRYARRESEVEDLVQEIFLKAYGKLDTWRGDAPFEHWLMRLAVRTCYDALRSHRRNREHSVTDLSSDEVDWLERHATAHESTPTDATGARALVATVLEGMSPAHRLIITLLEIEERSVKEIAELTGWSIPLVKVRAFRARTEMRKILGRISREKFL